MQTILTPFLVFLVLLDEFEVFHFEVTVNDDVKERMLVIFAICISNCFTLRDYDLLWLHMLHLQITQHDLDELEYLLVRGIEIGFHRVRVVQIVHAQVEKLLLEVLAQVQLVQNHLVRLNDCLPAVQLVEVHALGV